MRRAHAIRYPACGCLLLLWSGTALAETSADTASPVTEVATATATTAVDPGESAATDDCATTDACVDQYLWGLYERTPKIDSVKVSEQRRVTVTRKHKTRTVTVTVTRIVDENFAWKDLAAADKAGLSPIDYVIGGVDREFKRTLYRALHVMEDAGLMPGITSAFRDDYRQSIASGIKAQTDRSYHGGSFRGGYGHGVAVDLVSVKGATRAERCRSSEELWHWIDANGRSVGLGRPYLDRDPPHVAPIDGKEYADKRGTATRVATATAPAAHRQHAGRDAAHGAKRGAGQDAAHATRRAGRAGTHAKVAASKAEAGHGKPHRSAASAKGRARKSAT